MSAIDPLVVDGQGMAEFEVTSTWRSCQIVEVPANRLDELRDAVSRGELPDIVAKQIDARAAELVDWDAS